jgi:DNA-binding IclR family transcriptional regulator
VKRPLYSGISPEPAPDCITAPDEGSLVKSAARVIELLELFASRRAPLRAVEIGEALDLPPSSTLGLLRSLTETGHLLFDPQRKTYYPTLRVTRIAEGLSQGYVGALQGMMDDLHQATGECTVLSVQNGLHMQFLALLPPVGGEPPQMEGMKTRIIGTACGSAMLMARSDSEVIDLVMRIRRSRPLREREAEAGDIVERIRGFRRQGYAASWDDALPQTRTIAVPVLSGEAPPLALSIGGPTERIAARETESAALMRALVLRHGMRIA